MMVFGRRNRTDAEDNDELIKRYLVGLVNVPASPPESPERDTGLGLDSVRQMAEVDAKGGGWDQFAVLAQTVQFPSEEVIDHEVERRRSEHENTRRNREIAGGHMLEDAENLAVSIDGRKTSLAEAKRTLKKAREDLKELEAGRDASLAIVRGDAKDKDDTPWTGPVPTPPTVETNSRFLHLRLALRPERLKQWFQDIGLTLAALAVETIIVKESVELLIRDNGWFGYLYALPPLLVATVLPHVIGTRVAGAMKRGRTNLQDKAVLIVSLPIWVATVFFLAKVRTDATEQNTRARIARASNNEFTPGTVPRDQVDQQFSFMGTLSLWFFIIIAVGVSLLVLKVAFYNPYVTKLVKDYSKIAIAERNLAIAEREVERIEGQIELQNKSVQSVLASWKHYIDDILPSHALELKAHYRNCLINAYGDPDMTGAILAVPEGTSYQFAEPPSSSLDEAVSAGRGLN